MSVYSAVLDRIDVVGRSAGRLRQGLRPRAGLFTVGVPVVDLLGVALAVGLVAGWSYTAVDGLVAGLGTGGLMTAVVALRGGYRRPVWGVVRHEVREPLAGIAAAAIVAVCLAYAGLVDLPPQVLATAVLASVVTAALLRGAVHLVLARLRDRGELRRRVLLIGSADRFGPLGRTARDGAAPAAEVLGRCVAGGVPGTGDVLGDLEEAPGLVRQLGADTVVVAADALDAEALRRLAWRLEPLGVNLLLAPGVTEVAPHRSELVTVDNTPMVRIGLGPTGTTRVVKAVLDRVLGVIVFLAALAVLVPAMLAVKVSSPGPVFFRQNRVGEDGVPFTMLKLRTMYVDAEDRLAHLIEHSDGNAVLFKMRQDPRVTPVGRILRRFSIDELPQIWNVLRGDMSLVGPRPPLPREVAEYDDRAYHRLYAKPGLTGLWQVSGRSDLDWEESVALDLFYVDNRCTQVDLKILARTAGAVLGGRGAY